MSVFKIYENDDVAPLRGDRFESCRDSDFFLFHADNK